MFVMNNFLQENADQINSLEEKLSSYLPLEQFLKNDDAILCVKACGEKTKEYLDSSKIKKLIKLITEEPEDDNQIRGHKIPYIASEILKLDCPYILERFILSEKEYNEKYNNKKPTENKEDGVNEKTGNENSNNCGELDKNNIESKNDNQKENNIGKENNEKNGEEYKFMDSDEDSDKDSDDDSDKDNNENNDKKDVINKNMDLKNNADGNKSNANNDEEKNKQNSINEKKDENSDKEKEDEKMNNEKEESKKEAEDKTTEDKNKNILKENEIEKKKDEDNFNSKNDILKEEKKEEVKKIEEEKNNNPDTNNNNNVQAKNSDKDSSSDSSGSDDSDDSGSGKEEMNDLYSSNKNEKYDENNPHNVYLDLLINFVMSDKPELNYVLSGYFLNVIQILLDKYPSKLLTYLYNIRKDALKRIVFRSHQNVFSTLSSKLLNLENFKKSDEPDDYINNNINFRNELVGDIIKSMNLEGFKDESGKIFIECDMESKLLFLFNLISDNKYVVEYLLAKNDIYVHILGILDIQLFTDKECSDNNFDKKYGLYRLFLNLVIKLVKTINLNEDYNFPTEFNNNCIQKEKSELSFNEYMIIIFENILKNNFMPKKPAFIIGNGSKIQYEGLGRLNINILDLVAEMLTFMKKIPNIFDSILINNNFVQNSINYFFKYQWNNLYHQKFILLFKIYLKEEINHKEITEFIFGKYKLHEILTNYLNSSPEADTDEDKPKKFKFDSGKKINSGVYVHIIDLMYKIQVYSGLQTFTKEEREKLKIINLGEYEFLESEKCEREEKKIDISQRIGNILKESQEWNNAMDNIVMPIIKKFEYKFSESEATNDNDNNNNKKDESTNSTESNGVSNFGKEGIEISPNVIRRNRTPPPSPIKNKARRNMLMKERMNSRRKKYVVEEDFFGENGDKGDKKENDINNDSNDKNGDNIDEINIALEKNKSLELKEIKKDIDKDPSIEKEEENKIINNNIDIKKQFDINEEKITFDLPKNRDKNIKSEPKRRVNINNDRRRRKMKSNKAYDDADFWED